MDCQEFWDLFGSIPTIPKEEILKQDIEAMESLRHDINMSFCKYENARLFDELLNRFIRRYPSFYPNQIVEEIKKQCEFCWILREGWYDNKFKLWVAHKDLPIKFNIRM